MKSLTELWNCVLHEMGTLCGVSTTRDAQTLASRFDHEGVSFLTITLTNFGSDLQKGLDRGYVARDLFTGFRWQAGLPVFLRGFLELVFERGTGRLLDMPCKDSILAIRQLTLMFGKVALPCSPERERAALRKYVQCESDVRSADRNFSSYSVEFEKMSRLLFGEVFAKMDLSVYNGDLKGKHGPGATADRLRGNAKFDLSEWTSRLERVFPYGDNALPSWRFYYRLDRVDIREPRDERPVRVILVPKTLKTPRVIAVEPTCMQFMQQAILERFVEELESDSVARHFLGFSDQTPNQEMARRGSVCQDLATLDLSEASDRVSNQHVRAMTRLFPHFGEALDATRSRKADVPGHGVIRLAKYASMGSATCFPIEAVVFTTIVFLGIQDSHRRQLTRGDLKSYVGQVRVYGDDIIVPVRYFHHVIRRLELFGLKVNADKSFGTGKFRESCGRDYYDGTDVTPVRVRHVFPSSREESTEAVAAVSLRNRFYEAGLWKTARWMDSWLNDLFGGHYPTIRPTSPLLGRWSLLPYQVDRLSSDTHVPQARGYVVSSRPPRSRVSGEGALLKWFLKRGDEPFADRDHLERSGRPDAVYTKLRWGRSV